MVDTCDPTVACWSEDGETFIVKDPVRFEKQIIPQFFKHSKFSSFVRVSHCMEGIQTTRNEPFSHSFCIALS